MIPDVSPSEFTVSASGTVLYMTGAGISQAAELVWVSRSGVVEPYDSTWHADFISPALSPDGRELAVSVMEENTQLWLRRFDGSRHKLTPTGSSSNWRPSWSADGRTIRYSGIATGRALDMGARDIFELPADGRSGTPRTVIDAEQGIWGVENSRDGQWMLYRIADVGGEGSDVRARRLGTDTSEISFPGSIGIQQIALSPRSRWLAYRWRNRAGRRFG